MIDFPPTGSYQQTFGVFPLHWYPKMAPVAILAQCSSMSDNEDESSCDFQALAASFACTRTSVGESCAAAEDVSDTDSCDFHCKQKSTCQFENRR